VCKKPNIYFYSGTEPVDLRNLCDFDAVACPMTNASHVLVPDGVPLLTLANAPELKNVYATAEHAVKLVFDALRPNAFATSAFKRPVKQYRELSGKKVFVFGIKGRIGQQLVKMLSGFNCEVSGFDTAGTEGMVLSPDVSGQDIIIVAISATGNGGFFDQRFFESLKKDAIFINISRGEVVYEPSLLQWLLDNKEATAMLDVLAGGENSVLWRFRKEMPNLFITPHIGGFTKESREKTDIMMANKIKEHFNEK